MKVLIGVNSFNDLPYLRKTMPVVDELRRTLEAKVVVVDTAHSDETKEFVEGQFPEFGYIRHEDGNIGYGRTYNEILRWNPGHDYYLVYTSDVLLDPVMVKKFLKRMEADKSIAMAAGKLHYWDFDKGKKTDFIDSLGICAQKRHHFYDRGCGEKDTGQYDAVLDDFFGISGAVFLIRTAVVEDLGRKDKSAAPGGMFDERMWMYKEDIDLAYRLRWLGEKITIFPEVWGWHARTVSNKVGQEMGELAKADQGKQQYARLNSYKNHFLLLKNNFTLKYGMAVFLKVLVYEFLKLGYMLLRHPRVFFAGLKTLLFVKGKRSVRRVSAKKMLSYFQ